MEVNILESCINVQELYEKVFRTGSGSVSLFVGTQKEVFNSSVLGTVTGSSRNHVIHTFLTEVCREVKEKHNIKNITVNCWLDAGADEPCLAVCCLASDFSRASEAVNAAVGLINGSKRKSCVNESIDVVSADLIQVKASCNEINQRIQSFIERRREQVNADNIRDFCTAKSDDSSCARVDAVKIHRKDGKSHLRVRKVYNTWGPQTNLPCFEGTESQLGDEIHSNPCTKASFDYKENDNNTYPKLKTEKELFLNERINNIEKHIGLESKGSPDVLERLKKIEDRILYLEGLSPEYFEIGDNQPKSVNVSTKKTLQKKSFSSEEITKRIKELESAVQKVKEKGEL